MVTPKLFKHASVPEEMVKLEVDFIQSLNCPVTVLHEGAVLAQGNMKELKKNESVIEVYLGR